MPIGGLQHWIEAQRTRRPAPTRAWVWTLAFGIATLLFGLYLGQVFPQTGHDIAPGYGVPVLAFEFAGGQADLEAIFGFYTDPQKLQYFDHLMQRVDSLEKTLMLGEIGGRRRRG